jgi:hypothetical protein
VRSQLFASDKNRSFWKGTAWRNSKKLLFQGERQQLVRQYALGKNGGYVAYEYERKKDLYQRLAKQG